MSNEPLEAAYPHITPHGIGVKGLEWMETSPIHRQATSVLGLYRIGSNHTERDDAWLTFVPGQPQPLNYLRNSEEQAKAAAQADYETRIRSALQRNPEGALEPVAWRCTQWVDGNSQSMVTEWKETADARRELGEEVVALYIHPPRGQGAATHRHKKRGSEYVLLGIGKMQAEGWADAKAISDALLGRTDLETSVDMRPVAIYRSVEDGSLWVRPKEEFEDGRFEPLSPKAAKGDGV